MDKPESTPQPETPEFPDKPEHLISIFLNDETVPRKVRPGTWIVSQLKAALGVDPALVLAELTKQGPKDLDDRQRIAVHEGEHFITHVRKGGSS